MWTISSKIYIRIFAKIYNTNILKINTNLILNINFTKNISLKIKH